MIDDIAKFGRLILDLTDRGGPLVRSRVLEVFSDEGGKVRLTLRPVDRDDGFFYRSIGKHDCAKLGLIVAGDVLERSPDDLEWRRVA